MFDLNDKVVLITGSTGGIGKSIARKMKEKGAKLILSGTRQDVLNNIVSEFGNEAKGIVTDLNDKDDIISLADEAEKCFGQIDVLINNAGVTSDNLFMRMKDEDWEKVININLTAAMRLTRQVIRGMICLLYTSDAADD